MKNIDKKYKEVVLTVSFENKNKEALLIKVKEKATIPFTASLIASVLLSLNMVHPVKAEAIEETSEDKKFEVLYEKYYSLLQTDASTEDLLIEESEEEINDSHLEYSTKDLHTEDDEIRIIKELLFSAIEKAGNSELVEGLKAEDLTIEILDQIFEVLVEDSILKDEQHGTSEINQTEENTEDLDLEDFDSELLTLEINDIKESEITEEYETTETDETIETEETTETDETIESDETFETEKTEESEDKEKPEKDIEENKENKESDQQEDYEVKDSPELKMATFASSSDNLESLSKSHTNSEFIEVLGKHAETVAREHKLYASVMIAQAALETGYGNSGLSASPNHNLYGMKGYYKGQSVVMRTREYSSTKGWHYVNAHFKKYPSYTESLLDHAAYIRRGPSWDNNFYSGVWYENTNSYKDATAWLQGRYATDPSYANKLNNIIAKYDLTRFDLNTDDVGVENPPTSEEEPDKDVKPSTGDKESNEKNYLTYTVKRGDTLSQIALNYKTTVKALKEMNGLKSDLILVGQNLQVTGVQQATPKPEVKPDPKPTPPTESTTESYVVKRGDTLSQIALNYKTTVKALKEMNNLKSDLILVGQKLQVGVVQQATPKPEVKPDSKPTTQTYIVKSGDTLSHIAQNYKMTVSELKRINNLKSDLIFVKQELKLASKTQVTKPINKKYTIKKGDTLYQIALENNTTVRAIKTKNRLVSDLIYVGQILDL